MLWSDRLIKGTDTYVAVGQLFDDENELLSLLAEVQTPEAFAVVQEGLLELHNPSRRQEWLAVRVLLARCLGGDKRICYDADGRPSLADRSYHISISHTKGYVALAWNPVEPVGIDIERRTDRVMRVVRKYVNAAERAALQTSAYRSPDGELLLWTAKEALYKVVGIRALDFLHALTVAVPQQLPPPTRALSHPWATTTAVCTANGKEYDLRFDITPDYVITLSEEKQPY